MNYYSVARRSSSQIGAHPGLIYLQSVCAGVRKILDVGCGEGTRLDTLLPKDKKGWGIDPSQRAIAMAKKNYPRHNFRIGVGEALPYPDASFDLVYSAFVIEHCNDPEKFMSEMIRVCKTSGQIVILAPNYGAPNRRSPNSTESPFNKFFEGLLKDFLPPPSLDWRQVTPKKTYTNIDDDTTWEPYLPSLVHFLEKQHLTIKKSSSLWELEPKSTNVRKNVLSVLGGLSVFPIRYWGPQLFIAAVK